MHCGFLAFGSEEATVKLFFVPNPGSSDTSRLHHASKVHPQQDQSHTPEVHWWGRWCHVCPGLQDHPPPRPTPGACLQKRLAMVTGRVWGWQWNWPFRTDRPTWRLCLLPLPWHQSPQRIILRQREAKNIKHGGTITSDEIANIACHVQRRSLAGELSGTIKEILGTAPSVGRWWPPPSWQHGWQSAVVRGARLVRNSRGKCFTYRYLTTKK